MEHLTFGIGADYINLLVTSPIELMETVTLWPDFIGPSPEFVPHAMISPGFNVISCDRKLTISDTLKNMSLVL